MPSPVVANFVLAPVPSSSPHGPEKVLTVDDPGGSASRVEIQYVAEGAANVVWSLGSNPSLKETLLRLRKGTWSGEELSPQASKKQRPPPPFISTVEVLEHFYKLVKPLFEPGELVDQELVRVEPSLVERCNAHLDEIERAGLRPKTRCRWHIKHDETFGMLITSMLPTSEAGALFHLKPKWLAQSPTAPPNARRCRTCALAAKRGTDPTQTVCSLALCSGDEVSVRAQIERLVVGNALLYKDESLSHGGNDRASLRASPAAASTEAIITRLTALFLPDGKAHKLLKRLCLLQQHYDPSGVLRLRPGADTSDLAMAMTLRDATMFVKLSADSADVRLGDLDPKSGENENKVQQWRETENGLINNGWYTGEEDEALRKGGKVHTTCFLWDR
ncbi:uncharacterized protein PV09_07908 [Verruconis gallopava]|uniref:Inositol-pentakisphosphate 2-kinase n=1 Tax=Verruconis gallopava TaxID=253628 RepID=A0A0D2A1J4_9PEZI|nr:uncharacterized protein PV09_07908 [Verruconis gallopava]KIW00553.1 hypothetical protein PV09_07908 [Verruconis gallopava]